MSEFYTFVAVLESVLKIYLLKEDLLEKLVGVCFICIIANPISWLQVIEYCLKTFQDLQDVSVHLQFFLSNLC